MSFAVVRGAPSAAQRYLDGVLAEMTSTRTATPTTKTTPTTANGVPPPPDVSVGALLLHCMRRAPDHVFMINGATGRRVTNAEVLSVAVSVARALRARWFPSVGTAGPGQPARRLLAAVRNHERAVGLYLGALLAGAPLVIADPVSSQYEMVHFLRTSEPVAVFCDAALKPAVEAAVAEVAREAAVEAVVAVDGDDLDRFVAGHSADVASFEAAATGPDHEILLLPTSGSTGLPKSAIFTNRGTLAQIPVTWCYFERFPGPTPLVLVTTTPQWTTFTMLATGAAVFRCSLLMSPRLTTHEHVLHMIHTYKVTFAMVTPSFVKGLMPIGKPEHFSSMETVHIVGAQLTSDVYAALKEKLPQTCNICDGFGMTEVQGYVIMANPKGPPRATGRVANIFHYKLVKENGEVAGVDEEAQLYIKTISIIKGYLKNDELKKSLTEDGWLPTGDTFVQDKDGNLYYRRRIKFSFKYMNQWVSPEEVERVASGVGGVSQVVVCASARGPAAALVPARGAAPASVARHIHAAVDSTLSDHKRLRGGVVVIEDHELPRTHSGKIQRAKVEQLVARLIEEGKAA